MTHDLNPDPPKRHSLSDPQALIISIDMAGVTEPEFLFHISDINVRHGNNFSICIYNKVKSGLAN